MPAAKTATKTAKATKAPATKRANKPTTTAPASSAPASTTPLPAAPGKAPPPWEQPMGTPPPPPLNHAPVALPPTVLPPVPDVPPPPAPTADPAWLTRLWEWQAMVTHIENTLKPLLEQERTMRKALAQAFFAAPKEGTNYVELPQGWRLKLEYGLDREFDEAAWQAVFAQLPVGSADYLIRWKPMLKMKEFRAMPEEQQKILEQCLLTKPKTPTLELIAPVQQAAQ